MLVPHLKHQRHLLATTLISKSLRFKCVQELLGLKLSHYYGFILINFWLVDKHPCGLNFLTIDLKYEGVKLVRIETECIYEQVNSQDKPSACGNTPSNERLFGDIPKHNFLQSPNMIITSCSL